MLYLRQGQRPLWEAQFPEAKRLLAEDPVLRVADHYLDDDEVLEPLYEALSHRWEQSRRRGRVGYTVEQWGRLLYLKHAEQLSYERFQNRVEDSLKLRLFARLGETVPDAKSMNNVMLALPGEAVQEFHRRVVAKIKREEKLVGRKMRVDTTVSETHIHYPTDSSLLQDGVRVLTRLVRRGQGLVGETKRMRDRLRSVGHRVMEINRSRNKPNAQARRKKLYRKLMSTTRKVVREAKEALERFTHAAHGLPSTLKAKVERACRQLEHYIPMVDQVLEQTYQRVVKGVTDFPEKLFSLFEPHTELIRKGKVAKPNEFGKLVKIQECENQLIVDYEVFEKRPADELLWVGSIEKHEEVFGRPPYMATADAGFASKANEEAAAARRVKRVALPKLGKKSDERKRHERQRWFRRAQRWRVGSEGRISHLKRCLGLNRCRYKGMAGMQRWVGFGVVADCLKTVGRMARKKKD
jgi:IS5 family transposase